MSDEKPAEPLAVDPEQVNPDEKTDAEKPESSFGEMLSQFEESHRKEPGAKQLEGTVISVSADAVYLDIGYKTEGVLARTAFRDNAESVKAGDKFFVSVKGRNEERYYELSLARVAQPRDWTQLEEAFAQKTDDSGYGDRRGEGRPERGCGRARVYAGFSAAERAMRASWRSWWGRRLRAGSRSSMWRTKT